MCTKPGKKKFHYLKIEDPSIEQLFGYHGKLAMSSCDGTLITSLEPWPIGDTVPSPRIQVAVKHPLF